MDKTIIITRGCSGSGKSTTAEFIKSLCPEALIISNDDYFIKNGIYKWNAKEIILAEISRKKIFADAIKAKTKLIIVANTNLSEKKFKYYDKAGRAAGYQIFYWIIENRHDGQNSHNVPDFHLLEQEIALRNSLKLSNFSWWQRKWFILKRKVKQICRLSKG